MPRYVHLIKWTDQGARNIKLSLERSKAAEQALQKVGGRFVDTVYTMGQYDLVVITEAPDDETIMAFLLQIASLGNVRTETLKAFSREQMQAIIEKVPG